MIIQLKTDPDGIFKDIEIKDYMTVEDLYFMMKDQLEYTVVAAKVDNRPVDLNWIIKEPCRIEFLDMRTQQANLIYQYSLSLIYLKAVEYVMGDVPVEIRNSLNKGLYTEILSKEEVTEEQVKEIEKRMREMVDENLPFLKVEASRRAALQILEDSDLTEKKRLLEESLDIHGVRFYSLEGYRDFFYGYMVPSTGYIDKFELRKYRHGVLVRFPHPSNPNVIPEYHDEVKLYHAFAEQTVWDNILGVRYVTDLNEKISNGEYKELIQISEALHEKKIAEIADRIRQEEKRIILIAGPSSSGKTTFARRLCIQLKVNGYDPLYLGTDDYFLNREETPVDENGEKNFENLDALDIDLFNTQMNDLLLGKEVDIPRFDFISGKKIYGERITSISSDQPIVIEGIHGLNEELTKFISHDSKFKIYISPLTQLNIDAHNRIPATDERMLRRMVRDNLYRGNSAADTIKTWPKVREGEDRNIFPYSGEADVFFNSYHVYEISVLRKYAEPLLMEITSESEQFAEAQRMLEFIRFFKPIEDDSMIVNNSIIREFIGGSIFVD